MTAEHLDVLIVGAGLSGIDAAYRVKTENPTLDWAAFEARSALGGTWDLFRYPGVRSDSDMATLGFPFHPWRGERAIAAGGDILEYIRETARLFDLEKHIRLDHRVTAAEWSTRDGCWNVTYELDGSERRLTCSFLFLCSGYYDYSAGHTPTWPGIESFGGTIVHPQFWPQNLPLSGKRIIVIGSGATAVTLVPSLVAEGAAQVTMLQRSPTYIVSRPSRDKRAHMLRRRLPRAIADVAIRWRNIVQGILIYAASRKDPERVKQKIAAQQRALLGEAFDIDRHLTPRYNPWDQRLCLVPDGDLFEVLRSGQASIVTDTISGFDAGGVLLSSGDVVPADIVITATGLSVKLLGGAAIKVDGESLDPGSRMLYKGSMLEGVPNFALSLGYTNASWTLKCDLTARFIAKLLKHMRRRNVAYVVPVDASGSRLDQPVLDLQSGYIERAASALPRQGAAHPWRGHHNYARDLLAFLTGRIDDGVLKFSKGPARRSGRAA